MEKLTALVIDESRIMREMVMDALTATGLARFEFVEAEGGADALIKLRPAETNIVFADWHMPGMSGIDFVREVRAMRETAHIPIIMVATEETVSETEAVLDEVGANACICRPFAAADLRAQLSRVMQEMRAQPSPGRRAGRLLSRLIGSTRQNRAAM